MVIGTYYKSPLDMRPKEDFPDPVERSIARTPVCALTGLQLYTLLQMSRLGMLSKEQIRELLLTTDGILATGREWRKVLTTK
jgi:hypothetical protein